MSTENAPIRDKERSIKYSYSVPNEDWATEMFFRELEFGSPELLDNAYYRSLRSMVREKADPSERVPRVDLATLLDDSRGIRNGAKEINVHIKRKSYMEAIANDPGMMYDFNIYEETIAREEEKCCSNEDVFDGKNEEAGNGLNAKRWQDEQVNGEGKG